MHQNCAKRREFLPNAAREKARALRARTGSATNEKAGAELPHFKTYKCLRSILLGLKVGVKGKNVQAGSIPLYRPFSLDRLFLTVPRNNSR